jgi:hypothetical protein
VREKTMATEADNSQSGASYKTLRRIVGILGVALPVILLVWGFLLPDGGTIRISISDYYALRTRDALVGILFTLAWFFCVYRGYERKDNIAGNLACVFALGVALFPSTGAPWEGRLHLIFSAALFFVLAYFSLGLFTLTDEHPTPQKKRRNRVYEVCGWCILACIALIWVYHMFFKHTAVSAIKPVFWLEALALWAFGISWFVKGETLLKDVKE